MADKDKRVTVRCRRPDSSERRDITTTVDRETFKRLYDLARTKDVSMNALVREACQNLVGTR